MTLIRETGGAIDIGGPLEWVHKRTEREERSFFGEFYYKGERKNEAVAGGKWKSREKI